jgi:hypothetical protein
MSFRFVGTALSILGSGASGYYLTSAASNQPPTVVVEVSKPASPVAAPAPVAATPTVVAGGQPYAVVAGRQPYAVVDGAYWQPRVWVGPGAMFNPVTGQPLTRDESESGWVDGAHNMPYEPTILAAAPSEPMAAQPPAVMTAMAAPPPPAASARPVHGGSAHGGAHHGKAASGAAPAAATGDYRIHLESYRDRKPIPEGWKELQAGHPEVLGKLTSSTATVTIPKKGAFVRLLAGPFPNQAAAEHACEALKATHQYCRPVAPGRESS